MKYVDEFRDREAAERLIAQIRQRCTQRWTVMEVCGGQTHGLMRYGFAEALHSDVELIHGPGCPVCVTPLEAIDRAIQLSFQKNVVITSFGDMLRVPGSRESLLTARAKGGNVRAVYSPSDAVSLASSNPEKHVVFFAVGFETTAPATALAALQAQQIGLNNFSLLVSHVRVQPAMESIAASPDCRVQGFLAAGHVCTVMGYESYAEFVQRHHLPVVITGFEPIDLLEGILETVTQLEEGWAELSNRYARSVRAAGNVQAQDLVRGVYEVCDKPWRGIGLIPAGGLRLKQAFRHLDAEYRFPLVIEAATESCECRSGEVLSGSIKPTECAAFGTRCRPDHPLGAPMVSSEGACAAYFRYARHAVH